MARRHFVTLLALFGFANIYAMRANLSVAIVEMTTGTNYLLANGTIVHVRLFSHLLIENEETLIGNHFNLFERVK